jgi:hypothetical protein
MAATTSPQWSELGGYHETGSERKHSEADNNPRGPIRTVKPIPNRGERQDGQTRFRVS